MSCSLGCCCCENESPEEAKRPMSSSPLKRNICCTDIIFLIIFIAFWAGMIYLAAFSVMQGAALRLLYGYDSFGNTCNNDMNSKIRNVSLSGQDTSGLTNVFFFELTDPFKKVQLCVSKCPDKELRTKADVKDFYDRTGSRLCYYTLAPEKYLTLPDSAFSGRGPCPKLPIYKSESVANRCLPLANVKNLTQEFVNEINKIDQSLYVQRMVHDLFAAWKEMIALCCIALVIALIMVFLIRYLATFIVWIIVGLSIIACLAATGFLWWTYVDIKGENEGKKPLDIPILDIDISNERAFLIMAIVATVLTVILLLIILVMRKRIALVVALFHEAGKCIGSIPVLLLQPVWTFLILIVFFAYWVIVLGFLSTAGTPHERDRGFAENANAVDYSDTTPVRIFWWYHLIGLIWTSEFILGCQQMVIAGSVAMWFFTRDKKGLSCTVGKATCRVILHHLGSVAFGAFIITLVKLPRWILMYIQQKCKDSQNECAQFCLKCCICCLWCLEKLLKFLNQNAYTIVVIEGKSFCPAAKKAFMIITSNVLRVAAINSVGDFVLFLGKIGVMASTAGIGILWFKEKSDLHYYWLPAVLVGLFGYFVAHCVLTIYEYKTDLQFWGIPILLVCVFAYFIAHCFLAIYEMVIDTLLLCFCEDCNINDGTEGREYFMSKSLMEVVKGTSSKLDAEKKPAGDSPDAGELEALPTMV